jgi:hypothetical protein
MAEPIALGPSRIVGPRQRSPAPCDRCRDERKNDTWMVVHHMGKDTNRGARGSNALNGAADVTMFVEKSEAYLAKYRACSGPA